MRVHPPATDDGAMEPTLTLSSIRINGHLGPTALSAFPAMVSQLQGGQTVLTGLLPDRSALYASWPRSRRSASISSSCASSCHHADHLNQVTAGDRPSGAKACARGTTSGPGFVTSDQWKIAPRRPMLS